jgi:hypothetical protein
MHVVPRLLALPASKLPAVYVPTALLILSLLVTSFVAMYATRATHNLMPLDWTRKFFGLAIVAIPVAGAEALGNLANLQQWLWLGAFLTCIGSLSRRWERVAGTLLLVGAGLSSPLSLILVPLVIWRRRHDRMMTVLFLSSVVIHVLKVLSLDNERVGAPIGSKNPITQIKNFLFWVPNGITANNQTAWTATGITFVAITTIALWKCRKSFCADAWVVGGALIIYWYTSTGFGQGATYRHAVVPGILVVGVILIVAQSQQWMSAFALTLLILWISLLGVWGPRTGPSPSWIEAARNSPPCDTTYPLPIAPGTWGIVRWPCDRL